jgi:hypothetical protein
LIRAQLPFNDGLESGTDQVTQVIITFSNVVNANEADSTGNYQLKTPGKRDSYTAKNAKIIALEGASLSSTGTTITLTPKKPFALTKPVQLVVHDSPRLGPARHARPLRGWRPQRHRHLEEEQRHDHKPGRDRG